MLPALVKAPRLFLDDPDEDDDDIVEDLVESKEIISSVAKHWAPLRRAIESGEIDLPSLVWGDDE